MASKRNAPVNPERKRVRYTPEFKREAVRLLELGQKPATQLALELGVRRTQLYRWQAQLKSRGDQALRNPGRPPLEEESEVSRLKREVKRLAEEVEILKKAKAYFAKHHR